MSRPATKLRLIAMCASHVSSEKRLVSLGAMLDSWKKQTFAIPLHLSVSAATPELKAGVRKLCYSSSMVESPLTLYLAPRGRSQFEHYATLTNHLTGRAKTDCEVLAAGAASAEEYCDPLAPLFVLFSDDDDTWDPERACIFHHILQESEKQGELPTIYAALEESGPGDQSRLKLEEKLASSHPYREYYHFAVRLSCLTDFITRSDPQLLRHRFADCFFVRYLLTPQGRDGFPNLGSDMKRFHANRNLYSATVPLGDDLQSPDRAHSSPYEVLRHQTQVMYEQQHALCQQLDARFKSTRKPDSDLLAKLKSAFNKHAKIVDMLNRLTIIDGFCCLMQRRYTPPDYETFRRELQAIDRMQDAVLNRQASVSVHMRFPDSLRAFYDKLVATDVEFLRFINAPLIAALPQ